MVNSLQNHFRLYRQNRKMILKGLWFSLTEMLARRRIWVLFTLCFLIMIYFLHKYYAWHLILLQGILTPERSGCGDSEKLFVDHQSPSSIQPLKFGILMLFDERMLREDPMTQKSVQNKKDYASLYNYEVIIVTGDAIDQSRPPAWSKFLAMKKYLVQFDYLIFFDVDTIIMNDEVKLEQLIETNKDFILTEDWNGLNTGVYMMKNSEWSLWLLEEAWGSMGSEQEFMALHEATTSGQRYPFEYEQRSIHYIFQTEMWKNRYLPVYKPELSYDNYHQLSEHDLQQHLWKHLAILPQCKMNSYLIYPSIGALFQQSSTKYVSASYVPGDFVVHMAGHKGSNKIDLFNYCLSIKQTSLKSSIMDKGEMR